MKISTIIYNIVCIFLLIAMSSCSTIEHNIQAYTLETNKIKQIINTNAQIIQTEMVLANKDNEPNKKNINTELNILLKIIDTLKNFDLIQTVDINNCLINGSIIIKDCLVNRVPISTITALESFSSENRGDKNLSKLFSQSTAYLKGQIGFESENGDPIKFGDSIESYYNSIIENLIIELKTMDMNYVSEVNEQEEFYDTIRTIQKNITDYLKEEINIYTSTPSESKNENGTTTMHIADLRKFRNQLFMLRNELSDLLSMYNDKEQPIKNVTDLEPMLTELGLIKKFSDDYTAIQAPIDNRIEQLESEIDSHLELVTEVLNVANQIISINNQNANELALLNQQKIESLQTEKNRIETRMWKMQSLIIATENLINTWIESHQSLALAIQQNREVNFDHLRQSIAEAQFAIQEWNN